MSGHVEKIINDKFYFVVDEVGPSDCDSELGSENDGKEENSLNCNQSNQIIETSSNSLEDDKIKNAFLNSQDSVISKNHEFATLTESSSTNANREVFNEPECVPGDNKSNIQQKGSRLVNKCNEGLCVTVDMDLGSEEENENQNNGEIKPLIRVIFKDKDTERFLKSSLAKFLSQKIHDCSMVSSSDSLELMVYEKTPEQSFRDDIVSFDLDATPTHGHNDIPHYGRSQEFILSDSKEKKNVPAPVGSCFNCLGNHNLKNCKEVKNFKVINRNRLLFNQKKEKTTKSLRTCRYHLDEAQRFNDIHPGAISKKLRNALNLHSDQQPSFIYRMRLLGYPPAWLEEAKVSHSGVAMYDGTGVPVLEEDEEEGEIIPEGSKDKFDITKIIEFPGFNVPLPNNFKEEAKLYGCPDISDEQSKQNLVKMLEPKTVQAYVKKSLPISKSYQNLNNECGLSSPTIEEMEERKRQLLMELDDEESSSTSRQNSDELSETRLDMNSSQDATIPELGSIKTSEFGTPILKSVSPFAKLPSRELFSVNVSDVINFENLPNSTGKYETMRHVITKIRDSISRLHNKGD